MIKAGEQYLTDICTMKGCTVKIVIFYFFSRHDLTAPHTKFHVSQTPPSCFLLIYDPFLTNIWRKYFSCNHFTVLHQLKLKWSNLDQNWAKSQPLLLKILKSLIVLWGCIAQCPWNWSSDLLKCFYKLSINCNPQRSILWVCAIVVILQLSLVHAAMRQL